MSCPHPHPCQHGTNGDGDCPRCTAPTLSQMFAAADAATLRLLSTSTPYPLPNLEIRQGKISSWEKVHHFAMDHYAIWNQCNRRASHAGLSALDTMRFLAYSLLLQLLRIETELVALKTRQPQVFIVPDLYTPAEGDQAAIRYINNWDGQEDVSEVLAVFRDGEWWPDAGGDRLLHYVGSRILKIWPLQNHRAAQLKEEPDPASA